MSEENINKIQNTAPDLNEPEDDFFDSQSPIPSEIGEYNTMPDNSEGPEHSERNDIMAKNEETKSKKKKIRKTHPVLLKITVGILSLLCAALAFLIVFATVTMPKDTVANNVMIESLNVSGLTYDETLAAVEASFLFENRDITIECSGKTRTLDGGKLELRATPEATAQKAFNYGKSGNIFKDSFTAIRLLFCKKVIVPIADMNHDVLNRELGEFGIEVCGLLTQVSVDFTDTDAVVTPGTVGFDYNTDTSREQILNAISNERFDDIRVTLNAAEPDRVNADYIDSAIYRDVADAYYDIKGNDIMVIAEVYGRYCNREDIERQLDKINTPGGEKVYIPYQTVTPQVFSDDLSAKLFSSTLGSYYTSYADGGNRGKNVARAASLINGKILRPGEVFSFNDTVGNRTKENGFYSAPEYSGGQSVIGIGGGTCQVSSTLYSAALYADMGIVDRTEHMMKVGYMPAGQDATVAYGSIDFKFKNTSDYPIKIAATTGGGRITVSILGAAWEPARKVDVKHYVTTVGENTVVTSKRLVYSEGQLISTDALDSSSYAPHKPAETAKPSN